MRFLRWLRQRACALRGHDHVRHFDRQARRIVLVCMRCGHETPGVDIGRPMVRVLFAGFKR
jgi:hypothetical protein